MIGTDTGGSVRVPASYCGILGFRPSHDAISTAGVIPMSQSFDTVGKESTIRCLICINSMKVIRSPMDEAD